MITGHGSKQEDPASLYGVLCPDWIKWAIITEDVFPLTYEQGEERYGILTKHTVTGITAGT